LFQQQESDTVSLTVTDNGIPERKTGGTRMKNTHCGSGDATKISLQNLVGKIDAWEFNFDLVY
jgi:hypothetical protein